MEVDENHIFGPERSDKTTKTFRIEGMVERKYQSQNDKLYSETDKNL